MAKMYDSYHDAIQRVQGTIITYKGLPHYVRDIRERGIKLGLVYLREHDTADLVYVDQEDEELSFAALPLGYVNTSSSAAYAMRAPARRWKQGIDHRAVLFTRPDGSLGRLEGGLDMRLLCDCFEGIYPTFSDAMGMFVSKNPFKPDRRRSVAFSRQFSVEDSGASLSYRGRPVGKIGSNGPELQDKFRYLIEALEEDLK